LVSSKWALHWLCLALNTVVANSTRKTHISTSCSNHVVVGAVRAVLWHHTSFLAVESHGALEAHWATRGIGVCSGRAYLWLHTALAFTLMTSWASDALFHTDHVIVGTWFTCGGCSRPTLAMRTGWAGCARPLAYQVVVSSCGAQCWILGGVLRTVMSSGALLAPFLIPLPVLAMGTSLVSLSALKTNSVGKGWQGRCNHQCNSECSSFEWHFIVGLCYVS
jgi:hypothetical protein